MIFWSTLPDLNRSPVSDEAFVLLRELSRQCLEEIRRGRTATTRQLLSMLAEVRGWPQTWQGISWIIWEPHSH